MKRLGVVSGIIVCLAVSGCATDGSFDSNKALAVGVGVVQAVTLDENSVKQTAALSAKQLDDQSQVAGPDDAYTKRLMNLVKGMQGYKGLTLNFKVYKNEQINAFAMADGTVRVYSGLMDSMPDDQVFAVIGHEIGHVYHKHSYEQLQKKLLTESVFQGVISTGGIVGQLTQGQLGQLALVAVNAQFSQHDELESDGFAVKLLKSLNKDPYAMKRAIETLQAKYGSDGSFLDSHPSNKKRIAHIEQLIAN